MRPSGVLIMRKLWKPVDPRTKAEYASEPVPEPVQCYYRWHLLSEPEILGNANGICAEVVRNRSQMSVCPMYDDDDVTFYSFLNNSSQNGKNADPPPQPKRCDLDCRGRMSQDVTGCHRMSQDVTG